MSSQISYEIEAQFQDAPWFISRLMELRVNRQMVTRPDRARSSAFDKMGKVLSVTQENNSSSSGKGAVHWLIEVEDDDLDANITYKFAWAKYSCSKVAGVDNLLAHIPADDRNEAKKKGGVAFLGEFFVRFSSMC